MRNVASTAFSASSFDFKRPRPQIPELQDANVVDSVEGVLWSIGPKHIARFDGQSWSRIHHPDNPPIGAPSGCATP